MGPGGAEACSSRDFSWENFMIEIVDLKKSLGGKEVLRGVSLEVKEGELVVIIGGSGMGKSVLLKHIIGFLKPDSGDVIVNGVSVSKAGEKELYRIRENYGVLFQTAALLHSLTVRDNMALPLREHTNLPDGEINRIITERLNWVELYNVEDKLPTDLSVGMMKRVGLARAIVRDPKIVLFDEPTTGLDPVLSSIIGQLIVNLHKRLKFTSIAVTHDMSLAYIIGDRIGMLYNGELIQVGTPDEIRSSRNPVVRQFIYGMPEVEEVEA